MSEIHKAIPAIMAEVGAIEKGRTNTQQGYRFRGIDDAYAAFQPLFAKHGVFVLPTVIDRHREERTTQKGGLLIYTTLTVKHAFVARDGTSVECVTVGEAMDSGDKSSNKAMSAAMKYALLEVFCVPTEEDNDTENHSHAALPKQHAKLVSHPRTAPSEPKTSSALDTITPAQAAELWRTGLAVDHDENALTFALREEFPYLVGADGHLHLTKLKLADLEHAKQFVSQKPDDLPMGDVPAATPARREFWPETEFPANTQVIVAMVADVKDPVAGKSGKLGPSKVDIQTGQGVTVMDTFDTTLAEVAKAAAGHQAEIAYVETVNGRFTNRKLVGVR